jgi:hypothetical protein
VVGAITKIVHTRRAPLVYVSAWPHPGRRLDPHTRPAITANDTYVSVGPLGLVDFTKLLHSSTVAGGFSSPFSFQTVGYYEKVVGANNSTTDGSTTTFDGFGNYCTLLLHGAYDANDVATYQGTTKTQFSLDLYQFTGTADPSALGIMAVPEFGDRCSTN